MDATNGVTDKSMKCVMVIDSGLPLWLRVNTAGLLVVDFTKRLRGRYGTRTPRGEAVGNFRGGAEVSGVALYGPKKSVNKFGGNLPLLR